MPVCNMPKYICTIKASITLTKEVEDIIEIESPDEVQAEEDALVAAENIDPKYWLSNLSHSLDDIYDEIPSYNYLIDQSTKNLGVFLGFPRCSLFVLVCS